jgi:hypothetical protein
MEILNIKRRSNVQQNIISVECYYKTRDFKKCQLNLLYKCENKMLSLEKKFGKLMGQELSSGKLNHMLNDLHSNLTYQSYLLNENRCSFKKLNEPKLDNLAFI